MGRYLVNQLSGGIYKLYFASVFAEDDPTRLIPMADVLSPGGMEFDVVINLAALINPEGGRATALIEANSELPAELGKRFPNARFVQASSVSVYGSPLQDEITEAHPFNNPSDYGLSKLAGEIGLSAREKLVVLRFPSLYGVGMSNNTFIPRIVQSALCENRITLYGDGSRRQTYLHVEEAARVIADCIERSFSAVINVCPQPSYSNNQVAELISRFTGCNILRHGVDSTPSTNYVSTRYKEYFSHIKSIPIEQGLEEYVNHER